MRVLLLAALLAAGPVIAGDLVARQGNDSVRLTEEPCPIVDAIVGQAPQGARGYLRLARAEFQGQQYTACWAPNGNVVHLWYEDGDQGVISTQELKPAMDI